MRTANRSNTGLHRRCWRACSFLLTRPVLPPNGRTVVTASEVTKRQVLYDGRWECNRKVLLRVIQLPGFPHGWRKHTHQHTHTDVSTRTHHIQTKHTHTRIHTHTPHRYEHVDTHSPKMHTPNTQRHTPLRCIRFIKIYMYTELFSNISDTEHSYQISGTEARCYTR